jgi:hypothetical protein
MRICRIPCGLETVYIGLGEDGGAPEQLHHSGGGQAKHRRAAAQQGQGRHHRPPQHAGQHQVSCSSGVLPLIKLLIYSVVVLSTVKCQILFSPGLTLKLC